MGRLKPESCRSTGHEEKSPPSIRPSPAAAAAGIPRGGRLDVPSFHLILFASVLKRHRKVFLERVPLVLGGRVLVVGRALVPAAWSHGAAVP
jgi:hypothetical protein